MNKSTEYLKISYASNNMKGTQISYANIIQRISTLFIVDPMNFGIFDGRGWSFSESYAFKIQMFNSM